MKSCDRLFVIMCWVGRGGCRCFDFVRYSPATQPRLTSNLWYSLASAWNYKHEPLHPAKSLFFFVCLVLSF